MRTAKFAVLLLGILGLMTQNASAQQWGTVTGRFVVNGKPNNLKDLTVTQDNQFCGNKIPDPALQVDSEGNLKDAALWLFLDRGDKAPDPHPMYAAKVKETVVVDNKDCLYDPQVALVCTGQEIEFKNSDPIPHNFKIDGFSNGGINTLVPAGGSMKKKFNSEEKSPMMAGCTIHGWMKSRIVMRDSPYMAVSGENGKFTIENLPVGKHQFQVWHPVSNYVKEMKIDGKTVKDRKGIIEIDVKPGNNDLGDIVIDANLLK
ncbi:hypothetical protein DTL21_13350 [Bremerella cremea]|uniref:Rhamnogalacturonan lyase domain-containing protein n=1 Tax=Blastopirellula marina TaxID=124 RepID=A0A2S8FQP7_9BACT|nr:MULTISPECIES: hypothetical protein [Pirellulaceae]PQO34499.1 hypothetical protein C5Y83_13345 [Blastopirellula marina]RCS46995.1 hypothetical protein DTL21_13350 [Bremerella cremea]